MSAEGVGPMDAATRVWLEAHARLVREVGRSLTHALRGHLNGLGLNLSLGEQLVAGELPAGASYLPQTFRVARQEVTRLETVAERLQALVSDGCAPQPMRFDLAAQWAAGLATTVAEEREVRLVVSVDAGGRPADDLPIGPEGLRETLALWLIDAARTVAPGGTVHVEVTPDGATVRWLNAGGATGEGGGGLPALGDLVRGVRVTSQLRAPGPCEVRLRVGG